MKRFASCAAVLGVFIFCACENPYVIHNLARPVTAQAIEFRTDKDKPDDPPYSLKPVFAENIFNYTVYVHESAENIFPTGYPEEGASVTYQPGVYLNGEGEEIPVPFKDGAYRFPPDVDKLTVKFTVSKEYRLDGPYTVEVRRRPDPGRLRELKVTVAYYDETISGRVDPADPGDLGWIYETDNHLVNYDASGSNYTVDIPYYAQKVAITPEAEAGVRTGYSLYRRDPVLYPEELIAHIDFDFSAETSQYFDFTGIRYTDDTPLDNVQYENPHLYVDSPYYDAASRRNIAYLVVHTIVDDPATGERRYPQDYTLKLMWKETLAYLRELHVQEGPNPAEWLLGNFYMGNTGYEAEVPANTTQLTINAVPRDLTGCKVSYQFWTSMVDGEKIGLPVVKTAAPTACDAFDFPNSDDPRPLPEERSKSVAVEITVENSSNPPFNEGNNWGKITYWVEIRRAEPLTQLYNIKIEGYEGNSSIPRKLFVYDDFPYGFGPRPQHYPENTEYSKLKSPSPEEDFDLKDETDFTLEIDGTKITRLKITAYPDDDPPNPDLPPGTVQYKVGNNGEWEPSPREFEFTGGGAAVIVSRPGHKDRLYSFTLIRTGAQVIELFSDTREPPEDGTSISGVPLKEEQSINNSERGTFDALMEPVLTGSPPTGIAGGKPVNNALPGKEVWLRITPKLGWAFDKLEIVGEDGEVIQEFYDDTKPNTDPNNCNYTQSPIYKVKDSAIRFCKFTMPKNTIRFLLTYKHATGKVGRVAYVAPENWANRYGAYGTDAQGAINADPGKNNTGTTWAYATSNLQGVIDAFDSGAFDEIWVMEGNYYLRSNKNDKYWAKDIPPEFQNDDKNLAFVLKEGVRIYGGFKGTEGCGKVPWGNDVITSLKDARAMRFKKDDGTDIVESTLVRKTVLNGSLRNSNNDYVRHVVIAAGIQPPAGDTPPANRADLKLPAGYDFAPPTDVVYGVFGNSGVTLLDTIAIRNGMAEKRDDGIQVNNQEVLYRFGGGLYCVNASPYLRNVLIGDNSAVMGGGMYTIATAGGTSAPVLQSVTFSNNNASGHKDEVGSGGGFTNAGGGTLCMPAFLDCTFENNTTVGGPGAGLYMRGGKALVRNSTFRLNIASGAGGGIYNGAETWVYKGAGGSLSSNQAFDGAAGIYNGGSLYLVDTVVNDAITNNGTLSGTTLTAGGIISRGGSLALVNSTLAGLDLSQGPAVLANVDFTGNSSLSFGISHVEKDPGPDRLGGVILTNVTFNGGGISASYANQYNFHHGAVNLLLNNVLLEGGSLNIGNTGTTNADGKSGVYVTMNNVTLKGGLTVNAKGNVAVPVSAADKTHDVLDLRIRNSLVMGGSEPFPTRDGWPLIGTFAEKGDLNSGTLIFRKEKAALLKPGDTFVVFDGGTLRPALYTVYDVDLSTGEVSFTPVYPGAVSSDSYKVNAGNTIVLSNWTSIGTTGSAGTLSYGVPGSLTLTSTQTALLPVGAVFKISDPPLDGAPGTLVCKVTAADLDLNKVNFDVLGSGSQTYTAGSHIMFSGKRPGLGPIGSRLKTETGGNSWDLGAKAFLFEQGTTFRLSSGGTLTPSVNTVTEQDGNTITFTADSRDAYAEADKIAMVSNGDLSLSSIPLILYPHKPNSITVTAAQAARLSVGDTFRLLKSDGTLRDFENTITEIDAADPVNPKIKFTATKIELVAKTDIIMIVTDIPIGQSNLAPPGNLSDGVLHIDPDLAALMPAGKKFRIQKADGTLNPAVLTVSAISGGELTFTGGSGNYTRDDYIVFPVTYTDLKGAVQWDYSMARGAEKAPGSTGYISGAGKTAADVLENDNTPKAPLIDAGNNDLYPRSDTNDNAIEDLLNRCFEQYEANGGNVTSMRTNLENLFKKNLFTWSDGVLSLPEEFGGSSVGIHDFLGTDRAGGDRFNGAIDVGAYEK